MSLDPIRASLRPMWFPFVFSCLLIGCGAPAAAPAADGSMPDLPMVVSDLAMPKDDLSLEARDMSPSGDSGASPDLGGACNTLSNDGPLVQEVLVNQAMPSPTSGGTIVAGTYYLTDSKIYQGSPSPALQLQVTQTISGSTMQTILNIGPNVEDTTRTFSTSGTSLTLVFTCGSGGTATLGFDATPTQYVSYNFVSKVVNTYTKQ